jgi:hypothetical protein
VRAGFLWLAVVALIGVWPASAASGQTTEEPPPATTPAPAAEAPKQAGNSAAEGNPLDTFLLRDSKGNLVPVLGMSFDEFEQLLRMKKGLAPAAAPGFTLERLTLAGTANEKAADLEVKATIRVRQAGWVRVPLGLGPAVLRQQPKHEGPGDFLVDFDAATGGFVCGLSGNGAEPHVVTLQISVGLTSTAGERRMALPLAHATESSLRLVVSEPNIEATLIGGNGISTTRSAGDQKTEIAVLGAAGDLQLAWRPKLASTAAESGQLDANGEISVRVQSEHRVTSDARLRVRSYGPPLESFRVRLPPGMELLPLPPGAGIRVTPLPAGAEESTAKGEIPGQIVEVRLEKPASGATDVVLRVSRDADAGSSAPLMPARFQVLGAIRQRGTIDFLMDGEWQLDWSEDKSVHRIDLTPDTAAARIVARFEYFRQPCELALKVTSQASRVSVEPMHMVFIDAEHVRIETLLKYRFRGSRASGLSFALGDWRFDRLMPDALLDFPVQRGKADEELYVPFRAGIAPPTELELKLEAHRTLAPGSDRLALTFPRPLADIVAPATILVFAADNLELTPEAAELVGLSPDPAASRTSGRDHAMLAFRDFGGGEPAQFVAKMRLLSRTTTTSARAKVRIERQQLQFEQILEYRVAHEPQQTFLLLCPSGLLTTGDLQVSMNDEPLSILPTAESKTATDGLRRMQFSTPIEQIGSFRVTVQYSVPLNWDRNSPLSLEVPLVLPPDEGKEQFTSQHIEFVLPEGMAIEPDADRIEETAQPMPLSGGSPHAYSWSDPVPISRWMLEPGQAAPAAPTTVVEMWVQTWLTPQIRRERVAFGVTTQQESVRINLPKGVRADSVQTAINGQEVAHGGLRDVGGHIAIALNVPAAARGHECVLEVYYTLEPSESIFGTFSESLQAAKIEEALPPRRMYWQLLLPEDRYLIASPDELTSEMAWAADRWPLMQRPVMDQRQLEAWIKASRQPLLPRGANEYLFGELGHWPALSVVAAPRWMIASVASIAVLGLGLLLIHVPVLRSPAVLLTAAVIVAGGALAAPLAALILAQGAILGLGVVIMAIAVAWIASGRAKFAAPPVSSTAARPRESSFARTATPRPYRSSRLSATAPAATHVVEARP